VRLWSGTARSATVGSVSLEDRPTLCVDIGATTLKAVSVAGDGQPCSAIRTRRTNPPIDPETLVAHVQALAYKVGPFRRVGLGFPGVVRHGRVISPGNLACSGDRRVAPDDEMVAAWQGVELQAVLEHALEVPCRLANDADVAALYCSSGDGVELTITLGSGVGSGLTVDGALQSHLELSEIHFDGESSLDAFIGESTRNLIGDDVWGERVIDVLGHLKSIINFDRLFLTGGNARRLRRDALGPLQDETWVVKEPAGLLGGFLLFSAARGR